MSRRLSLLLRIVPRKICEAGYKAHWRKKILTNVTRKKRLEWAKVQEIWNISELRQVTCNDDSEFSLMSDKSGHIWRKAKDSIRQERLFLRSKHPESVIV